MKDKIVVVTGASRGIGRATCVAFAKAGAKVVINYAGNEAAARETEALCKQEGAETLVIKGDVAKAEDCKNIIDETIKTFGRVDVLVNNAGITRDNILMRMSDEEFDQVIGTNMRGTYLMMKAVARPMMKQKYGRIVNLASVVGIMGNSGQVNYAASKGGVIAMTKSFAREIATKGVTVNAVAPGFIDTDMTKALPDSAKDAISQSIPKRELGQPEDVAAAILFFAGDQAGYITGQVLCVDGGMCM